MSAKKSFFFKLSVVAVVFLTAMVVISSVLMTGQPASRRSPHHVGVVDDWSFHHLVYSNPGTYDQVKNNPEASGRLYRIQYDTRYIMQQMKRNRASAASFGVSASKIPAIKLIGDPTVFDVAKSQAAKRPLKPTLKKDWSAPLLTGAVLPNMFPATYADGPTSPSCANDYVVYPTGSAGIATAIAASGMGTFTNSSGTGSVVVNSLTLTASAGGAASQSTTISANGVASGNTITITNPLVGSPLVLTASTPQAQVDTLGVSANAPGTGSTVVIAGITYNFQASGWVSGSMASTTCYINESAGQSSIVSYLASAITTGSANTGASTSTWQCGTSASQPSAGVTVTSSTSPSVVVTAKIVGLTGFTTSRAGTNEPSITVTTAGSNGSAAAPNFQWWSGAAAVSATTLATNIKNAIGAANAVGVGATNPVAGQVKITATLTGLAGNSIAVATTISSGLASPAFSGNLSGGTAGTTSGATFATSTDLTSSLAANEAANASNLVTAITANVPGFTAASSSNVVTVTDNTAGAAGNSVGTTSTIAVFTWANPTLQNGSDPTATIIAYNNLYATFCSTGSVPSVFWAYNTGTGYSVTTSPVLSLDGSEVAFIQTTSSDAELVVLKWASSSTETVTAPGAITTSTNITTCSAPCMSVTSIGASGDTYSSPFYDYFTDTLYVGDNASNLHKITGVFNGTSSPSVASISLSGPASLASPVYDSTSGCVFVGDTAGFLYSVSSGVPGSVCTSSTFAKFATSKDLGGGANEGIFDGPLVDSTAGMVYAFVAGSSGLTGTCATVGHNCVNQFSTGFTGAAAAPNGAEDLGGGGVNYNLYGGNFDNVYYSSPGSPTGNLYVIGNTIVHGGILYQVKITANVMGAPTTIATINSGQPAWASPVTEFFNTSTGVDYIFASAFRGLESAAGTFGSGTSCYAGTADKGCVFAINVTNPAAVTASSGMLIPNSADATSGHAGCWGTSGIVVDNSFSSGGTSNVYFVNLNANFPAAAQAPPCNSGGTPTGNTIQAVQGAQSGL